MRFDAIVCPRSFPSETDTGKDRDVARNAVFGPLLGSDRVISRWLAIGEVSLVTRHDDHTTLMFPSGDPRHPQYQHEWFAAVQAGDTFEMGDRVEPTALASGGVFLGRLKG